MPQDKEKPIPDGLRRTAVVKGNGALDEEPIEVGGMQFGSDKLKKRKKPDSDDSLYPDLHVVSEPSKKTFKSKSHGAPVTGYETATVGWTDDKCHTGEEEGEGGWVKVGMTLTMDWQGLWRKWADEGRLVDGRRLGGPKKGNMKEKRAEAQFVKRWVGEHKWRLQFDFGMRPGLGAGEKPLEEHAGAAASEQAHREQCRPLLVTFCSALLYTERVAARTGDGRGGSRQETADTEVFASVQLQEIDGWEPDASCTNIGHQTPPLSGRVDLRDVGVGERMDIVGLLRLLAWARDGGCCIVKGVFGEWRVDEYYKIFEAIPGETFTATEETD